jgi:ATP-dependent DNA ligase
MSDTGTTDSSVHSLPVPPPVRPMLAKRVDDIPHGGGWLYEPKWDGFRTLVFRNGGDLLLQSRDCKPMNRYFPELVAPLLEQLPERCVIDGELVIAGAGGLEFETLQARIHPAASRVAMLAERTPASLVAWDLLCVGDRDLTAAPFRERRALLERLLAVARPPLHLTPLTASRAQAEDWFQRFEGAGLDGLMAKEPDAAYQPGKRTMLKVKHRRTADCVVAGLRWHRGAPEERVGSLLLGLYDGEERLHHIGVAGSFTAARRRELVEELRPYRIELDDHPWHGWTGAGSQRRPGAVSRWSTGKDLSWVPLRPQLVVEVSYDHMQGSRLRHTAQFVRWRPDKDPSECTYDQLEITAPFELQRIFGPA